MKSQFIAKAVFYFSLIILLLFGCKSKPPSQGRNAESKFRFIYNNDGTEILGNRWHNFRPLTIEDVNSYVDVLANTPVTTFMMCSGSMLPYYQSKFERPLGVLSKSQKTKPGEDLILNENMKRYAENFLALQKQGTDIMQLCINRAQKWGMEAFITMRMNDLHFTDPDLYAPAAQSDFWLQHPEYRMGDYPGWHADGALNFEHEAVRQYKLNLIREQCELFDLDGIELDFMRFLVYFPYGKGRDYLDVMTDFVRKARTIADEVGEQRGRKILLAVRVPPRIDLCLDKGLDVSTWANENLVDMITVAAHWTDDPALPINKFKKDLGNIDIAVYASLESGQYHPREFRSHGMYRAAAAHCLNQGADGIYLFNFFFQEFFEDKDEKPKDKILMNRMRNPSLLSELARTETLKQRNKIYSLSDGIVEYGYKPNTPLPLFISPWDKVEINISLAEDFPNDQPEQVCLFLRMTKGRKTNIKINDSLTEVGDSTMISQLERNLNLSADDEILVRSIPIEILKNGQNTISIESLDPIPLTLKRLEVAIIYGEPETSGYF
jgi:hypothetical protein